MSHVK